MRGKLQVGCGANYFKDYWNTDRTKSVKVDQVVNLNEKLPFQDNQFKEVLCSQTLQYIDGDKIEQVLSEMLRVCSGPVKLRVAHSLSGNFTEIDPKINVNMGFLAEQFHQLDDINRSYRNNWNDYKLRCNVEKVYIELHANNWLFIKLLEKWINKGGVKRHKHYQRTLLSRLAPPRCIEVILSKRIALE